MWSFQNLCFKLWFIHESPCTHILLILYHVTMKLLLLFNLPCFDIIIYWTKPWFNGIMMNSCYSYKFHDISIIVLNHELQVFDKIPTRVNVLWKPSCYVPQILVSFKYCCFESWGYWIPETLSCLFSLVLVHYRIIFRIYSERYQNSQINSEQSIILISFS